MPDKPRSSCLIIKDVWAFTSFESISCFLGNQPIISELTMHLLIDWSLKYFCKLSVKEDTFHIKDRASIRFLLNYDIQKIINQVVILDFYLSLIWPCSILLTSFSGASTKYVHGIIKKTKHTQITKAIFPDECRHWYRRLIYTKSTVITSTFIRWISWATIQALSSPHIYPS